MPASSPPDLVPLTPARPAWADGIPEPLWEHGPPEVYVPPAGGDPADPRLSVAIGGLLLVLVGLAAGGVLAAGPLGLTANPPDLSPGGWWALLGLAVALTVGGLALATAPLWHTFAPPRAGLGFALYPGGVAAGRGDQWVVAHWDDVRHVRFPQGVSDEYTLDTAAGPIPIPRRAAGHGDLTPAVLPRADAAVLANSLAALDRGEAVNFGRITLRPDAIVRDKRVIPWEHAAGRRYVVANRGRQLKVWDRRGDLFGWWPYPASELHSYDVLVELLDRNGVFRSW